MALNFKSYSDPFILEKSKLDRLATLLRETIDPSPNLEEHYEIHHADGTLTILESTDKVYQLDNSGKKLISSIKLRMASNSADATGTPREVEVEFEEDLHGARTTLSVLGPDPRWVASTFALIEEQVERCLKKTSCMGWRHLACQAVYPSLCPSPFSWLLHSSFQPVGSNFAITCG